MTVKEFLKALEDIKRTRGYNHFDLYLKYDDEYVQVWLGRIDPEIIGTYPDDEDTYTIIPRNRNLVEFATTRYDGDLEEIYDSVEKFKKALTQRKIADNAVIQLTIDNLTAEKLYIDYSHDNKFDIIKVVPAKRKNTVVLDIADFGSAPQLKTYEIDYQVWELNKYSVEIDAYSKEEAEAKFYEKYKGEGKPYRKDEDIIAIREK